LPEFYPDQPTLQTADPIALALNQTLTLDAAVDKAGTLSGTITAADNANPLQSVTVYLYETISDTNHLAADTTDGSGYYEFLGLLPEDYYLRLVPSTGVDPTKFYIPQYYDRAESLLTADAVAVPLNTGTTLDITVDKGAIISGVVTAADTTLPLADVYVYLYAQAYGNYQNAVLTTADGRYQFNALPAGDYFLEFRPRSGSMYAAYEYLPEFYPDKQALYQSDPIVVAVNTVTEIDAALTIGAKLNGTVTDEATDAPIEGASISVRNGEGQTYYVNTDAAGDYELVALPADIYYLFADPPAPYIAEYHSNKLSLGEADGVEVLTSTVNTVDVPLTAGGTLSGVVTGADNNQPLSFSYVYASDPNFCYGEMGDSTNSSGEYYISGLPLTDLVVSFGPSNNGRYIGEYYNGQDNIADADRINIPSGETLVIDYELPLGGTVSGTVTAADTSLPINAIYVSLERQDESDEDDFDNYDT
ncbi:MAG: carboxypeptidase regulatory-like domain-containing protein, partial [Anaerolineales bacterium]|nr:carboxypeptidase regulatory-like domain-containing protein [Anaerolineales bacterium]